jgi:hypothetical protein
MTKQRQRAFSASQFSSIGPGVSNNIRSRRRSIGVAVTMLEVLSDHDRQDTPGDAGIGGIFRAVLERNVVIVDLEVDRCPLELEVAPVPFGRIRIGETWWRMAA